MEELYDKVIKHLNKIDRYKKPYLSTNDLGRTSNKMVEEIRETISQRINDEYESDYNDGSYLRDVLLEVLPNIIQDIIYENIRDLIIKDKTKIDEYDRLQDEMWRLQFEVKKEHLVQKWKKERQEMEVQ